jgi:hypothetical protein
MLIRAEKPITKEQYARSQVRGGYIDPVDMGIIFNDAERYGYGIYDAIGYARYNDETKETAYIVSYTTSTCCD